MWRRKSHQPSCAALYQIEVDVLHPIVFLIIALFHILNTIVGFISIHCTIIIVLACHVHYNDQDKMDADYNETHEDWASFGLAQELIVKEYR